MHLDLFPWFLIENLMGCHWKIIHFDWKIPCETLWFVIGNHFIWWCSPMGLIQLIPIKEVIALMLLIKGSIHKLMLKCLAEIIEPMRGWLIGYGFLKMFKVIWNFSHGFSLKILWVAIGKSFILIEKFHVEPYDLSLEIISFDDAHQWASSSLSQSKRSLHSCCSSKGASISSCSNALQRSLNPWGVD